MPGVPEFEQFAQRTPSNIEGHDIVNPAWLERIKREAYNRGLQEAEVKKNSAPPAHLEIGPQPPGAWAPSPYPESIAPAARMKTENSGMLGSHYGPAPHGRSMHGWSQVEPAIAHSKKVPKWTLGAEDSADSTWGEEAARNKTKKSTISDVWGQNGSSGLHSPWAATFRNGKGSSPGRKRSKSGKAASLWTVETKSDRDGSGVTDSWDNAPSEWSTTESVLSPREAISKAQKDRHTSRHGRSEKARDDRSIWSAVEAASGPAKDTRNSNPWVHSPPQGDSHSASYGKQSGRERDKKRPQLFIPPLPIPLAGKGGHGLPPSSPPPAYADVVTRIFQAMMKNGYLKEKDKRSSSSGAATKMDDSPLAMGGDPTGPVVSPTDSWFTTGSEKTQDIPKDNWFYNTPGTGAGTGKSGGWETKVTDEKMPGSWDTAEDSEGKPNDGAQNDKDNTPSWDHKDSHSCRSKHQKSTKSDKPNPWANGKEDSKKDDSSKEDSWGLDMKNGNNDGGSWENNGFAGIGEWGNNAEAGAGDDNWETNDAEEKPQDDAAQGWTWDNTEQDKKDFGNQNDSNGAGADSGWDNDKKDENKSTDASGGDGWPDSGGAGGDAANDDWDDKGKKDSFGGGWGCDWGQDDNNDAQKKDDAGGNSWENHNNNTSGGNAWGGNDWGAGDNGEAGKKDDSGGNGWGADNNQNSWDNGSKKGDDNQPFGGNDWGAATSEKKEGSKKDGNTGGGWNTDNNNWGAAPDSGWNNNDDKKSKSDSKSTKSNHHPHRHRPPLPQKRLVLPAPSPLESPLPHPRRERKHHIQLPRQTLPTPAHHPGRTHPRRPGNARQSRRLVPSGSCRGGDCVHACDRAARVYRYAASPVCGVSVQVSDEEVFEEVAWGWRGW